MSWLTYGLITSLLAGLGAAAAERALRSAGRPGRLAWLVAALLSLGLPLAGVSGWTGIPLRGEAGGVMRVIEEGTAGGFPVGTVLTWAWIIVSGLALSVIGLQTVRARRASRSWPVGSIGGVRVLISPATGPATLGMLRPVIVVPRWLFGLSTRDRRLAVLHEQEHRRVGDVLLLNGMAVLVALVPWQPVLWWHAARLHRAIELDCDERVVRRVRDRAGYCRMLVEAATRRVQPVALAAGLGRRPRLLEHRIRSLIARPRRGAPVVAGLALALFAITCAFPTPFEPGRGRATSTFRLTGAARDSLREVTVGTVRALGKAAAAAHAGTAPLRDSAAGGTYQLREVTATGVLRRADPEDPRLPQPRRR